MIIKDSIDISDVVRVAREYEKVELSEEAKERIRESRKKVERFLESDNPMYGINTGFGALANVKIDKDDINQLQINLVRSHSAGVGPVFREDEVRAMMLLRVFSLARGYSGVREEVVEGLINLLNHRITPFVPSQGSVGASGDLAPLAHIALVLMGEGYAFYKGEKVKALQALKAEGLKPVKYEAKEGLALTNGAQAITAVLALTVHDSRVLFESALVSAAMAIDALKGSTTPFDARIHELRPHSGQIYVAQKLRDYLKGSEIRASHLHCSKVQDAYSLRAAPQVLGAVKDTIDYVEKVTLTEMNSVTDNPLIFDDGALSGGNFHGEPVALVADFLGIALSELANITERRIDRLVNPLVSGLPSFLATGKSGLNSGMMIWQYTAASLVSENKVLAHPASVDSIPTSAYQEDHVSMGTIAARKARMIFENTAKVIAIESMLASRAVNFHKPLKTSEFLQKYVNILNGEEVEGDAYMGEEFERILDFVKRGMKEKRGSNEH
ncbi:histidine ammonia-lyase [Mesoaciditoga lauensis]|uniref:histidine ammonia-lyase n=1 Tax=Mesoaciditoga lauensis TaxID=1495039 RepID=UPI0005684B5D|nr:histidine ammonia-lyase [Mesoaciditoga lauensis]